MERKALQDLKKWHGLGPQLRKPLVLRGARQIGKSYLVRDFCQRHELKCLEINFEKDSTLRQLFVEGHNSRTVTLLEVHFGQRLNEKSVLFLDEIQSVPEIFSRLRYFLEDTPEIAVIAAGSLLEFTLAELAYSVPVGRIEYLHLGPMRFEEYLLAQGESSLLELIQNWDPLKQGTAIPDIFHDRLMAHVRDFSLVGGMPEAMSRFGISRDFLGCESVHRSILETYKQDFAKYRKRIPLERLERVFDVIPSQVGKKWVHARISPSDKASSVEQALDALCKAKVSHRIYHSSGNGVPLAAEKKENLYKVLFLDVGLMGAQLGLTIQDFIDVASFSRVNEGALAEQWVGQHLLDVRHSSQPPELYYWVREKQGSMAEVDYLIQKGSSIYPIEVKSGTSGKMKSLDVFGIEKKKTWLTLQIYGGEAEWEPGRKRLRTPFYLIEQLPRIIDLLHPLSLSVLN